MSSLFLLVTFNIIYVPRIDFPTYKDGVVVTSFASPTSPGSMAGLKVNDVIIKVDDKLLEGNELPIETFISKVRQSPNKPLALEILRKQGAKKYL